MPARRTIGLAALAWLSACHSQSEPPAAPPSSEAVSRAVQPSETPIPTPTASDPDPTKAASLWLDRQTEPRQNGKYAPRDDCRNLPGARAFRERLAAAVLAKDAEAIAALASADVRLGFAGDDGRRRLLAKLQAPDGELMRELAQLLPLGCAPGEGGGLTIPWFFAQDYGGIDGYDALLVTGADVPLHAGSSPSSPVKQRLAWDMVTLDKGWFPEKPLQQVTTLAGAKGWVATSQLRSMLDYRLLATRQGDSWKITAIVAGD